MDAKIILALLFFAFCLAAGAQSAAPKLLPFQARLTDASGAAVIDGTKLVLFEIYDVPTGGQAVWAGEMHKTTVNGGLVNVLLGSKSPLDAVDFNKTLYLQVTVDSNADNAITSADPPLLPRQVILPAVFAKEAAVSRTVEDGAVTGAKLAPGAAVANIGTAGLLIAGNQVAAGTINQNNIASNAVGTVQIQDSSISLAKLATRSISQTASTGGIAYSSAISGSTTSDTFVTVPNSTIVLSTVGHPVFLCVTSATLFVQSPFQDVMTVNLQLVRTPQGGGASVVVGSTQYLYDFYHAGTIGLPLGAQWLDNPGTGTFQYSLMYDRSMGMSNPTANVFIRGNLMGLEF